MLFCDLFVFAQVIHSEKSRNFQVLLLSLDHLYEKNQVVYISSSWLMKLVLKVSIITCNGTAVPCSETREAHGSWTPACSRLQLSPLAQLQHPRRAAPAWRHGVHWPLSRADTSHGDPGPREPAEQHWSQWRQAHLAPSICRICARSMPCAPEHGGNPRHAQSRFWECVLRQFCSVHGVLVVVSFFLSKQILGKYPSDRKLSKLWPKHCSRHA